MDQAAILQQGGLLCYFLRWGKQRSKLGDLHELCVGCVEGDALT